MTLYELVLWCDHSIITHRTYPVGEEYYCNTCKQKRQIVRIDANPSLT